MADELDPRLRAQLEALRDVPPRDPQRAAQGRAQFLRLAESMKPAHLPNQADSSQKAVSLGLFGRLKGWIEQINHPRKEGLKMANLLVAILMAISVIFGGGAATAYASQDALPGDALYPVKTMVEQAELMLTTDPQQKAELHVEFAQRRVAEIQALVAEGRLDLVPEVSQNLEQHLQKAEQLATQLAQEGHPEAAARVAVMLANTNRMVERVAEQAPPQAQSAMRYVEQMTNQVTERVRTQVQKMDAMAQTFHLTGAVEAIEDGAWVVNGQTIVINDQTNIEGDFQVGDSVSVSGYVDPEGQWIAVQIRPANPMRKSPTTVHFSGIIEDITDTQWTIAGQQVTIVPETKIEGEFQVGDTVAVQAAVDPEGTLVAIAIKPAGEEMQQPKMISFQGAVEAQNDGEWTVDGKNVAITADTKMQDGIQVGDTVMVVASEKEDGTLEAKSIMLITHREQHENQGETPSVMPTEMPNTPTEKPTEMPTEKPRSQVTIEGALMAQNGDTWNVNGYTVKVNAQTQMMNTVRLGDQISVVALDNGDGTYTALSVSLMYSSNTTTSGDDGDHTMTSTPTEMPHDGIHH